MSDGGAMEKRGVGRPQHVPDDQLRDMVKRAAGMGLPHESIARLMKIGVVTLKKHYKPELAVGSTVANVKVLETLFDVATDKTHRGCVTAAIFWTKVRSGWREVTRTEHTGADGQPIKAEISAVSKLDASAMTPEQREALREIIRAQAQPVSRITEVDGNGDEEEDDEDDIDGEGEEGEDAAADSSTG